VFEPRPTPPLLLWFLRVQAAFVRAELALLSRYRLHAISRGLSFAFVVASMYFFSRFVGAAPNRHLDPYGGKYLAFGLLGLLASDLQQVGVTTMGQRIRQSQLMGYLEAELATAAPAWMVLGASPIFEFGGALLRAALYLAGARLFLGVKLGDVQLLSVALLVPCVLAAFVGLGLLSAAATMLTRRSNPFALLLGAASMFLSGVVYPVTVLPGWLRAVGRALPLTHALEALRLALLAGASPRALAPSLGALALFGGVLTPAGLALFMYALRRARVDGSLSHY
jgi:ABC-2 type transport system permease protein